MRRRLAAAAPGEARRERCFGSGSALPERASRDAPPVSMDPLPPISGPVPTWIPMALALGFLLLPGTALGRSSGLSLGLCSCLPGLQLCFSVSQTPCSLALRSSQACGTSSGVQMRNIYSGFIMRSLWLDSHYSDLCFPSFGSSRCVPICSLASGV